MDSRISQTSTASPAEPGELLWWFRHDEALASGSAEEGRTDGLLVIAMTANALVEDRERCFAAGMDGYLSKPISLIALENEIARLFRRASSKVPPTTVLDTPATSIFDRLQVMQMLGDEDLFHELARMYIADAPSYVAEFDAALAAADWSRLNRSVHTLKGLFATFAAPAAEKHAQQLEQAASAGNGVECLKLAPAVRSHVYSLAEALLAA